MIEILILAIIQGVTEWLPISSSGHLVLAQKYMDLGLPVFFDVALHMGSLLVVLIVFPSEILKILGAVVHLDFKSDEGKLALYVILGSIATAAIGFLFRDLFESFFNNLWVVGSAFIITGTFYSFLMISSNRRSQNKQLNHLDAVLIGVAQGIALIPGVSRSGVTITTGLLRKVDRQSAFTFSFLLFIPAVAGAAILTAVETRNLAAADVDITAWFLGLAITVIVGYFSLKLLRRIILKGRFHLFAFYCWAIGFIVLLSQILGTL